MGREVEMPLLRVGKREVKAPLRKGMWTQSASTEGKAYSILEALHREDERKLDMSPQGSPYEGKCGHGREAPLRLDLTEVRFITWDPGEGPAGQHIFESKRPVETNKSDVWASMPPRNKKTWPH